MILNQVKRTSTDDDDEIRLQFDLQMKWTNFLTSVRFVEYDKSRVETPTSTQTRTTHQKDFDKVIFSSAFHRLGNKTQVFPLVKNDSVHNRLTHSLEVSAVGSCLARSVADDMRKLGLFESTRNYHDEYQKLRNIEDIVKTACLLHDIGNPPFGHSGEHALREWWKRWVPPPEYEVSKNWNTYKQNIIFKDFENFEGNASGFHVIMKKIPKLTHGTIASFVKYPRTVLSENTCWKKNGLYLDNIFHYAVIAKNNGLKYYDNLVWQRHPLTFLMEAADDICYNVVDLEDGVRMEVLPEAKAREALLELLKEDVTEKPNTTPIDQLRSNAINLLVEETVGKYSSYFYELSDGSYTKSLVQRTSDRWTKVKDYSYNIVYRAKSVIEIEAAGYRILKDLMHTFVEACLLKILKASVESEHLFLLLPDQVQQEILNVVQSYETVMAKTPKDKDIYTIVSEINQGHIVDLLDPIACILVTGPQEQEQRDENVTRELYIIYKVTMIIADYIVGMTDRYATSMYNKLRGNTL
jgi:dGTPase